MGKQNAPKEPTNVRFADAALIAQVRQEFHKRGDVDLSLHQMFGRLVREWLAAQTSQELKA